MSNPVQHPPTLDEWFHRKFGYSTKVINQEACNENNTTSRNCTYGNIKKDLEETLAIRRKEDQERRYSIYNAENEVYSEQKTEEDEDEKSTDFESDDGASNVSDEPARNDGCSDEELMDKDEEMTEDEDEEDCDEDIEYENESEESTGDHLKSNFLRMEAFDESDSKDKDAYAKTTRKINCVNDSVDSTDKDGRLLFDCQFNDDYELNESSKNARDFRIGQKLFHIDVSDDDDEDPKEEECPGANRVDKNMSILCSGTFNSAQLPATISPQMDIATLESETDDSLETKIDDSKTDDFLKTKIDDPQPSIINDDLFTVDDEVDEDVNKNNPRNTLVHFESINERECTMDDYTNDEEVDEYDEYESALGYNQRKTRDLIEDEASLSGDDIGSDQEEGSNDELNEYEPEEGDKDDKDLDEEEIRENLVKQYMKHQKDTDDRHLLKLQERLFADADLQSFDNDRSFRVRMRENDKNIDWRRFLGEEALSQPNDCNEDDPIEAELKENKINKLKWELDNKAKMKTTMEFECGPIDDDDLMNNSPLLMLGEKFLQGQTTREEIIGKTSISVSSTATTTTTNRNIHAVIPNRDSLLRKSDSLGIILRKTIQKPSTTLSTHVLFSSEYTIRQNR